MTVHRRHWVGLVVFLLAALPASAQGRGNFDFSDPFLLSVIGFFAVCGLLYFGLLIWAGASLMLSLNALPERYRTMHPALSFLLIIPCVQLVWSFVIVITWGQAFERYFNDQGEYRVGDSAHNMGMVWAVCWALGILSFLPLVGGLFSLASLLGYIFLIVYVIQIRQLAKQVLLTDDTDYSPSLPVSSVQEGYQPFPDRPATRPAAVEPVEAPPAPRVTPAPAPPRKPPPLPLEPDDHPAPPSDDTDDSDDTDAPGDYRKPDQLDP